MKNSKVNKVRTVQDARAEKYSREWKDIVADQKDAAARLAQQEKRAYIDALLRQHLEIGILGHNTRKERYYIVLKDRSIFESTDIVQIIDKLETTNETFP